MNQPHAILRKQERCDNEDRDANRCHNLTVFSYRGNDGKMYRLCSACKDALSRIAPSLRF